MSKILVKSKRMMIFSAFLIIVTAGFAIVQTAAAAGPAPVNLGTAGNYVILAKTGISTTGTTSIVGDIGVSPAAASYITGFGLTSPPTTFSTSSLVTGKVYAADYDSPTPASLTTAVSDMETAYTDAAGRAAGVTELGAGDISGLTIVPGVYKWSTGVLIASDVTLSGGANDVWIFQIAQDITVANGKKVILSGGAQAKNIFWQVAGQAILGTTSHFEGIILSKTAIPLQTGASVNGRLLAQTAVTLDSNVVTKPGNVITPTATTTSSGGGVTTTPTVTATVKATPKVGETVKPTVTVAPTVVATTAPAETAKPKPTATPKAPGFEAIIAISVIAMLAASILKDRKRR